MKSIKKILVPVDLSSQALETVQFAADLARRYAAELTIMHVYQPESPCACGGASCRPPAPDEEPDVVDLQLLAAKRAALASGAPQVETIRSPGSVAPEIVHVAGARNYDLIVMGSQERSAQEQQLFGSVMQSVVRQAPCPVITMRPPPLTRMSSPPDALPDLTRA